MSYKLANGPEVIKKLDCPMCGAKPAQPAGISDEQDEWLCELFCKEFDVNFYNQPDESRRSFLRMQLAAESRCAERVEGLHLECDRRHEIINALESRVEKLRAALEWYAFKAPSWAEWAENMGSDCGQRARQALAEDEK